ncbi:hypothetical protein LTR85_007276 [Meristemomyces frigidus]|nr:hypothetical protein LTR85_007276 [Meristemomyces frigidus]
MALRPHRTRSAFILLAILLGLLLLFKGQYKPVSLGSDGMQVRSEHDPQTIRYVRDPELVNLRDSKITTPDLQDQRTTHASGSEAGTTLVQRAPSALPVFNYPTEAQYCLAYLQGLKLLGFCRVPSNAGDSETTVWNAWKQMATWGWTLQGKQQSVEMSRFPGIEWLVYKVAGIEFVWKHTRSHASKIEMVDGKPKAVSYPPTNAEYDNMYWPTLGVIVAVDVHSPVQMVKRKITPTQRAGQPWTSDDKLPELQRWSDVTSLCWQKLTQDTERANLRWILHRYVSNKETVNMLAFVLRKKYPKMQPLGRAPDWDRRIKFTPGMDEFNALVGTPNVRGVAWLLIQHQSTFGRKTIVSITVYDPDPASQYMPDMMIEIGPAPS